MANISGDEGVASSIKANLTTVLQKISAVKGEKEVNLVAVSKTVGNAEVMAAYESGQRKFGENRIPSLAPKVEALPNDIEWHFIGRLQSNKVRQIIKLSSWIHAVDSISILERIDRIAGEEGKSMNVLIQVNTSGEESKTGFDSQSVDEIVETIKGCKNVAVKGLMTMAPYTADEEILRGTFAKLRETRDRLEQKFGLELPELSMGMSNDYPIAIEEGATIVRVGSSIFK